MMKTIDLPDPPPAVADLFEQARHHDLVVRLADGSEFLLVAFDEFDREVAHTRSNLKLMALLDDRARHEATIPFDQAKRRLEL